MRNLIRLLPAAGLILFLGACASSHPPRMDHIRLEVSELKASAAFYRSVLGLRPKPLSDGSILEAENMDLYLSTAPWGWQAPRREGERLGLGMYPHFKVADVYQVLARAKKAGYPIVQEPVEHPWGVEAFIADPDGYTWSLYSWRKKW